MNCPVGSRFILKFTLGNKKFNFEIPKLSSSVSVEAYSKPVEATENYNPVGYRITYYSPNNGRFISTTVIDYMIISSPPGSTWPFIVYSWPCHLPGFARDVNGNLVGANIDPPTLTINTSITCPVPRINRCFIEVKDIAGNIVFRNQGDCPATYEIQCGDCPPGTCKCQCKKFPGYCCYDKNGNSVG
jgi:hypothetical protein